MNITSMNSLEVDPVMRSSTKTVLPNSLPHSPALTNLEAGPFTGTFRTDQSPVTSGTVVVGEVDPFQLDCQRVAVMDLFDRKIMLGANPVTEESVQILNSTDLAQAAGAQEIGTLDLGVPADDPKSPFVAAAGLSRALCGFAAENAEIISAFNPGIGVNAPSDLLVNKDAKEFDGLSAKAIIAPRWTTADNSYGADIRICGSYEKGGRSPQLDIVAAVAALLTGTECERSSPTKVDIEVNVRVFCLERKRGDDGRQNGFDIPIKTEFHGETSVGGEFCDLANVLVKAFSG